MKLSRSTLFGASALALALFFTPAIADPAGGASEGAPPAAGGAAPDMGAESGGGAAMKPSEGATAPESAGATSEKGGTPGNAAETAEPMTPSKAPDKGSTEKGKAADKAKSPKDEEPKEKSAKKESTKPETSAETKGKAGTSAEGKAEMKPEGGEAGATAESEAESSGKPDSAKLESKQVNEVKTYFSENKPSVTVVEKNEVNVSIGVAIPGPVVLYDIPPDVIVVSSACPIKYFVWGNDIVLVDSCTREVVEILVGIA
jgi:hypothetical protein